jgi:RNA polymerase sigma-70 factor (ECF subfamily)
MEMPPFSQWYSGRAAIRSFFGWAFDWAWERGKRGVFRMTTIRVNEQIAFGTYVRRRGEPKLQAHMLQVLTFRNGRVGRLTLFVGPQFFATFGLPTELNPT